MQHMIILFWLAAAFVAYTYLVYPLGIWLLSRRRDEPAIDIPANFDWPEVTVVIAVHNEASRIETKIENLRALDYPQERLAILIVSDGSSDATNDILSHIPRIAWHAYAPRRGKAHALNVALHRVVTPVVAFADVRQEIDAVALKYLVSRLSKPGIGAVSGELVHRDPANPTAASIGLYWRYEKWIRKAESRFASAVGATGALYAIRREDFVPLADDALLDDFEIPMQIIRRGMRNVLDDRAIFFDDLQHDAAGEKKRKIRTLTGNFQAFFRHPWLFSPTANPVFVQFLSHKVFRLMVPYMLVVALVASAFAGTIVYEALAVLQCAFYAAAIIGMRSATLRRNRLVCFAAVFVEMNLSAVIALLKYAGGRVDARWEKT
jgi:biofilm PGA synthesis N-glycosyltransferase PgaC